MVTFLSVHVYREKDTRTETEHLTSFQKAQWSKQLNASGNSKKIEYSMDETAFIIAYLSLELGLLSLHAKQKHLT